MSEKEPDKVEFTGKVFDAELQGLPSVAMNICFAEERFSAELKASAEQYLKELFNRVTPGRLQ